MEGSVNGRICKREMHEFRKILGAIADEDMNDFLNSG
jgi:hypothetical protein